MGEILQHNHGLTQSLVSTNDFRDLCWFLVFCFFFRIQHHFHTERETKATLKAFLGVVIQLPAQSCLLFPNTPCRLVSVSG